MSQYDLENAQNNHMSPERNLLSTRKKGCLLIILFIGLFIYAPPYCVGCTQHNLPYLEGPSYMYDIHRLAKKGKLPVIAVYLLIFPEDASITPIKHALSSGHLWTAKYMLFKGGLKEKDKSEFFRSLMIGSKKNSAMTRYAKKLIRDGMDVNLSGQPWPPICSAAAGGNLTIARLLFEKGANIEARTNEGETALLIAAKYRHPEIVDFLVEKGADVNAQSEKERTAHEKSEKGQTSLMAGAWRCSPEIVETLLKNGADVNIGDAEGKTVFHILVKSQCRERLYLLDNILAHGGNLAMKDNEGRTPLHLSLHSSPQIVELLLEKGADLDIKDNYGQSSYDYCFPINYQFAEEYTCTVIKTYWRRKNAQNKQEKLNDRDQ